MRGALLLGWLACLPAAVSAGVTPSGYLKSIYDYTRAPLSRRPYWLDTSRARLSLDGSAGAEAGPRLAARVDYDHELRTGSYFRTPDFLLAGFPEPSSYLDMEQTIGAGNSYAYRHRLYRAWAGVEGPGYAARFGRQRIAWGTGRLWNPTDVLNPYSPTSLERDERRGTDSLYLRRAFGALGQGEAAWALGDRWASTDLLARARGNAGRTDLSVMGGKVASSTSSWMLGSDLSTDLWEGNLHGEVSYTHLGVRTPFWRGLVGYEYTVSPEWPRPFKDAWLLAEYFHNGAGELDEARYDPTRLLSGREIALARDYLGFGWKEDIHALATGEIYEIVNLDDGSHFLAISLAWNAVKDLYLTAGLQRMGGGGRTEFGRSANVLFFQGQYYF